MRALLLLVLLLAGCGGDCREYGCYLPTQQCRRDLSDATGGWVCQ